MMKRKATMPLPVNQARPYVMGIADTLSDDPMLTRLIGSRFKVIVHYDINARRVTYSFRSPDDIDVDDDNAIVV